MLKSTVRNEIVLGSRVNGVRIKGYSTSTYHQCTLIQTAEFPPKSISALCDVDRIQPLLENMKNP